MANSNNINDIISAIKGDTGSLRDKLKSKGAISFEQDTSENHWTGRVVDNNDSLKIGRVKIKIFGHYDNINEENLPWAIPEFGYLGSKAGAVVVPENGTLVRGYFVNGDEMKPVYVATAMNKDVLDSMPDEFETDYPNVMNLMNTDQGDYLTLNRKDGTLKFFHRSGTTFIINGDGEIQILTVDSQGSKPPLNVTIEGDTNVTSKNGTITCVAEQGNINVSAPNGQINIGENAIDKLVGDAVQASVSKMLVNDLPACLVTGAKHCIANTNVYV